MCAGEMDPLTGKGYCLVQLRGLLEFLYGLLSLQSVNVTSIEAALPTLLAKLKTSSVMFVAGGPCDFANLGQLAGAIFAMISALRAVYAVRLAS